MTRQADPRRLFPDDRAPAPPSPGLGGQGPGPEPGPTPGPPPDPVPSPPPSPPPGPTPGPPPGPAPDPVPHPPGPDPVPEPSPAPGPLTRRGYEGLGRFGVAAFADFAACLACCLKARTLSSDSGPVMSATERYEPSSP